MSSATKLSVFDVFCACYSFVQKFRLQKALIYWKDAKPCISIKMRKFVFTLSLLHSYTPTYCCLFVYDFTSATCCSQFVATRCNAAIFVSAAAYISNCAKLPTTAGVCMYMCVRPYMATKRITTNLHW